MTKQITKESDLYPIVQKWMMKHFHCFKSHQNIGLKHGRVDVIGVRDVGGSLSGEVETIAIEVKRGVEPFATASGQALGYQVYANLVYLAEVRETEFKPSEIEIASHLGIGLIQIKGTKCREVLSSPFHRPITRMCLELLEKMALGKCQLCGTFFETGVATNYYSKLSREKFAKAVDQEKGLMFWNRELATRKNKAGIKVTLDGSTHERRFICSDCIQNVFPKVSS